MIMASPQLEMRHLRLIVAVNRTRNLTRAAELLHISQPAASQCLKDLEAILQSPVFVRTKKQMILTKVGEEVLRAGNTILEEARKAETAVAKIVHGETGELRVGMHCILSWQWMPEVLNKMSQVFPRVKISVGNSRRYVSDLLERRWDVVITAVPINHPALIFSPLFSDEVVMVMHPENPLASKAKLELRDFNRARIISMASEDQDILLNKYLKPHGVKPDLFMTIEQPEGIKALVSRDFGISLLPKWSVETELKTMALCGVPITAEGMHVTWNAARLTTQASAPFHETFIQLCIAALG